MANINGTGIDFRIGLSSADVDVMRQKFGKNTLTPPKREFWLSQLLEKFGDPTIKILLVAAVVSLLMTALEKYALGHPEASFIDSIGIFLAVLLATLVGFFSEMKSAREFELLNKVKDNIRIKVLRDGQICEVSIEEIVVGDVIRLELGDKIPADGVIFEELGLQIDQSLLTGESVPVEKKACKADGDLKALKNNNEIDEASLVFRGTMIADGHGMFIATDVGDATRLGQIAGALGSDSETENETPLTHKLSVLAKQISVVGVSCAMFIFTIMSIYASLGSELLEHWQESGTSLLYAALGSAFVFAFLAFRYGLSPFFDSMDMKPKKLWLKVLLHFPLLLGSFVLFSGIFEIAFGGDAGLAIPLLKDILLAFIVSVTIIVVAVPEGLPMMTTVSLAMNMMKMARENCLVRKLVASETIGSATVICSDKTGTLTQNKMEIVWAFFGMQEYAPNEFQKLKKSKEWDALIDSIAINSEAHLRIDGTAITSIGNPTECAMLKFLHRQGVDYKEHRNEFNRIHEISHNSQRKLSLVMIEQNAQYTSYLKGAPERILAFCDTILHENHIDPIEEHRSELETALKHASDKALRVIAFSRSVQSPSDNFDPEKMLDNRSDTLLGLIGIADPIREEVPAAVETCKNAGVNVKMITGDALPTAVAIAKQAGILSKDWQQKEPIAVQPTGDLVLTSEQLSSVSDEDLPDVARRLRVLARSTPMDKLRLVKAMHRSGEVVAMTGDGTNDAPALKFADVGLSMGIAGTEVAKEASDIVLMDDNFKSIVTGIWWGRTLYQNIQRFLQFQLSVNVVALSCALLGPFFGVPLPLTVTQLLWINIIMDTFAAIGYSTDPPRKRSMLQKPIPRDQHIITPIMGVSILFNGVFQVIVLFLALYFGLFLGADKRFIFGADPKDVRNIEALTVFFTIFVMFQFWHKFNCRSLSSDESPFALIWKNKLFLVIVAIITVVQIFMVQASEYVKIGEIFRTTALSPMQWVQITLLTATIMPVAWVGRLLSAKLGQKEPISG